MRTIPIAPLNHHAPHTTPCNTPVEVVRPHLSAPLVCALASHPMFTLANWDPWKSMAEVLQTVKAFLEVR